MAASTSRVQALALVDVVRMILTDDDDTTDLFSLEIRPLIDEPTTWVVEVGVVDEDTIERTFRTRVDVFGAIDAIELN